jgi:nitrate reductase NapE component
MTATATPTVEVPKETIAAAVGIKLGRAVGLVGAFIGFCLLVYWAGKQPENHLFLNDVTQHDIESGKSLAIGILVVCSAAFVGAWYWLVTLRRKWNTRFPNLFVSALDLVDLF